MTASPLVTVRQLTRTYAGRRGIDRVSLEIGFGEIVGLLGPNGAGKTTLLECLLGLRQPDSGDILWASGTGGLARCGAQLQGEALPPLLTVREILKLHAAYWPATYGEEELLERGGLAELAESRAGSLSSGQRQRVTLALAFQPRAPLILLDEPSTGLDAPARARLQGWIRERAASGVAFLIASHDPWDAATLFQRGLRMKDGCIDQLDTDFVLGHTTLLRLETQPELTEDVVRGWPGVLGLTREGAEWRIETVAPGATLAALGLAAQEAGVTWQRLEWTDLSVKSEGGKAG